MKEQAILAVRGLAGWYEEGRTTNGTFTCTRPGGLDEAELTAPIRYDLSDSLTKSDNPVRDIWLRPNLDLGLPDNNVRNLLEGCVGYAGVTTGHPWDGLLTSLRPTDSVGLNVYCAVLEAAGAVRGVDPKKS